MWLKILNIISHIFILLLGLFVFSKVAQDRGRDLAIDDLERKVSIRMEDDRHYLENRLNRLQEQLDTYQSTREVRARIFGDRMDRVERMINESKTQQNLILYNNSNSGNQMRQPEQ